MWYLYLTNYFCFYEKNEEHLQDLEDYEAFARTVGALVYNTSHVDIIQLALSEPEESAVFKAAKNLTLQRLHVYTYEVTSLGPLIHNVPDNQKKYS